MISYQSDDYTDDHPVLHQDYPPLSHVLMISYQSDDYTDDHPVLHQDYPPLSHVLMISYQSDDYTDDHLVLHQDYPLLFHVLMISCHFAVNSSWVISLKYLPHSLAQLGSHFHNKLCPVPVVFYFFLFSSTLSSHWTFYPYKS